MALNDLILRNITATIKKADGSAWAGGEVRFSVSDTQADGSIVVPKKTVIAIANASGVISAALYTLEGGYLNYDVMLPGGDTQTVSLPDAVGTADLADLLQTAASAAEIAVRAASETVLGGVKVDGTTITIDGDGVISAVGGGGGASDLDDLTDVVITAPASGEFLRHNGTNWVDALIQAGDLPAAIDAAKIGDGSVSNAEFQHLNGVSGAIQTQLDGKAASSHTHAQSDITNLTSDLALKAPLASPALTGTPTAPTAAPGTNTTQVATTAYIEAAIIALVNGAPGNLDKLSELAAAINNDANFSTTVTNALNAKLAAASNLADLANAATARSNLGFEPAVRATPLTGLGAGTNTSILDTDTVLQAFAKLQNQIDNFSGGGITNGAGNNVIPKSDGTNIVASSFSNATADQLTGSGSTLLELSNANGSTLQYNTSNRVVAGASEVRIFYGDGETAYFEKSGADYTWYPLTDNRPSLGKTANRFKNFYLAEFIELSEMTAPASPGANKARLFSRDNGSGKTQLCVLFPSGAVQVLATEP